jgi:hypothetical protein
LNIHTTRLLPRVCIGLEASENTEACKNKYRRQLDLKANHLKRSKRPKHCVRDLALRRKCHPKQGRESRAWHTARPVYKVLVPCIIILALWENDPPFFPQSRRSIPVAGALEGLRCPNFHKFQRSAGRIGYTVYAEVDRGRVFSAREDPIRQYISIDRLIVHPCPHLSILFSYPDSDSLCSCSLLSTDRLL